jgi:hypothetical protein
VTKRIGKERASKEGNKKGDESEREREKKG